MPVGSDELPPQKMTKQQEESPAEPVVVAAGLDTTGSVEPSVQEAFADLQRDLDQQVPVVDVDQLRDEVRQAQDRALRAHAELENVRKRTQREIADVRRFAALPLLRDLLTVADNLDRAIAAAERSDQNQGLLEGVRMVAQQLHVMLENHGCTRIDADGQPFDPHFHEAILQQPSSQVPAGTIIHVAQNGYQLNGRVIRPSQVIVAAAPPTDESDETKEAAAGRDQ